MRITIRREDAQDGVALVAGRRRRRRLSGVAAAALLMALVAEAGVIPAFTGTALGAQVQADDDPQPDLPIIIPLPDVPVPVLPAPDLPVPAPPVPDPPKVIPTPPKQVSPPPSVAAPKNKKKHHKHRTSATPASATTSTPVVALAPVAFRVPRQPDDRGPTPTQPTPVTDPSTAGHAAPQAVAPVVTRPVSAVTPSTNGGLLWFAFADGVALAVIVGVSLWRRRRLGPQW